MSLFSDDDDCDDEPSCGGGDHDGSGTDPKRGNGRGGRGGGGEGGGGGGGQNPPRSSRGRSLRPWEWPDIQRGGGSEPKALLEGTRQKELEYVTPRDEQKGAIRRGSDGRDAGPSSSLSSEGRREAEPGEIGGEAAGPWGAEERRGVYSGLWHVKKRLWGSMFEGRHDHIKVDNVLVKVSSSKTRAPFTSGWFPGTIHGGRERRGPSDVCAQARVEGGTPHESSRACVTNTAHLLRHRCRAPPHEHTSALRWALRTLHQPSLLVLRALTRVTTTSELTFTASRKRHRSVNFVRPQR